MIVQSVALARRSLLSLGLFGALVTWVPDQLHVAHADDPPIVHDNRNPDARLQVLVKSVKVLNDRDPGSGEFWFKLFFWRVNPGCPPDSTDEACTTPLVTSASMEFSASDGETGTVNRAIPDANDGAWVYDATFGPEQGIPVFTDQTYGMALVGLEQDPAFGDDDVGKLFWILSADNNWDIGDRTERGRQDVVSHCFPPIPFVGGCAYNPPAVSLPTRSFHMRFAACHCRTWSRSTSDTLTWVTLSTSAWM